MISTLPSGQNLIFRTDFSDKNAWQRAIEAIESRADGTLFSIIDDVSLKGVDLNFIRDLRTDPSSPDFAFILDEVTLRSAEVPVLVVSLSDPAEGEFRVVPNLVPSVANNLATANLSISDFIDATDGDGVLRVT